MIESDDSTTERQNQVDVDPLSRDLINEMEAATREVIARHGLERSPIDTSQSRTGHVELQRASQSREEAGLSGTVIGSDETPKELTVPLTSITGELLRNVSPATRRVLDQV